MPQFYHVLYSCPFIRYDLPLPTFSAYKLLLIFQPPSSLTPISFPPVKAANPLLGFYTTLCEPLTALLHIIIIVCLEVATFQNREEITYGSFKYFHIKTIDSNINKH